MNFSEDKCDASLFVRNYDVQTRTIITSLGPFNRSIVLFAGQIHVDFLPQDITHLNKQCLLKLAEFKPEVILLGTGCTQIFPHPEVSTALFAARIGVEIMTTDAACRTFNILVGEGRSVLAALFV